MPTSKMRWGTPLFQRVMALIFMMEFVGYERSMGFKVTQHKPVKCANLNPLIFVSREQFGKDCGLERRLSRKVLHDEVPLLQLDDYEEVAASCIGYSTAVRAPLSNTLP
jgi:hypothetical protein